MNEIDWSEAPEWAKTVVRSGGSDGWLYWAEAFGTVSRRKRVTATGRGDEDTLVADMTKENSVWTLVEIRPTTPSWSGEGLPPVGVVCEAKWGRSGWSRCVVFAHKPNANSGVDVLVDVDGDWTFFNKPSMFRPIRTPEQIEADEREAAIDAMFARFGGVGGLTRKQCAWVIVEGYRKP